MRQQRSTSKEYKNKKEQTKQGCQKTQHLKGWTRK